MRFDDVRAEFASVLMDLRALRLDYSDEVVQRLYVEYIAELRVALKRLAPRARVSRASGGHASVEFEVRQLSQRLEKVGLEGKQAVEELFARYSPRLHARADELYGQMRELKSRLDTLARTAAIHRAGPEGYWHLLSSRHEGDYRSQGYGASRYAEGSVQLDADVARAEGFVDGVDLLVLRGEGARGSGDQWLAVVRVEHELDVEILRRLPGLPLREQVRLCWKRGVNPRVYLPGLPHGFEERTGLDYFGGEKH